MGLCGVQMACLRTEDRWGRDQESEGAHPPATPPNDETSSLPREKMAGRKFAGNGEIQADNGVGVSAGASGKQRRWVLTGRGAVRNREQAQAGGYEARR